jgi:hypothetical protein
MRACSEDRVGRDEAGKRGREGKVVKVVFFFSTNDLTAEVIKELNDLMLQVFSNDPTISFEKVFVEDSPKVTRFYNITTTPFTIIGDKRFPGIASAEQILKLKRQTPESEVSMHARPGSMVLLSGSALSKVLTVIRDMDKNERKVLLITKTYPEALVRHYDLETTQTVWLLPKSLDGNSISMNDIVKLGRVVGEFIDTHEGALVILEGLEALVKCNRIEQVVGLLQVIKFKVAHKKATAYILLLPSAMDEAASLEIKKLFSE